jgi:hypothetical protein
MAKVLRLIFAYPAPVVSNGVALFTVQMSPILLKRNREYFSEPSVWQPLNSRTPTGCGDVMPKCAFGIHLSASDGLKRFP